MTDITGFLNVKEERGPRHDITDRHDITEILLKVALNTTMLSFTYKYEGYKLLIQPIKDWALGGT
jgi:hypothetical protein